MSGVSGYSELSVYLSTVKDEQVQVAQSAAADLPLTAALKSFTSNAASLSSPAAILKNYSALSVLTGAFNMSSQTGQTAVLKALMTQDPAASTSLVQESSNTDYLHFADATSDRATQTAVLGDSSTMSLGTGGASASSLTMQNTAWSVPATTQTRTAPGMIWSFVLNDGSAADSIAAALTTDAESSTAVAATSTAAAVAGATYTVSASGVVTGSPGAPSVTTSTDSAGNTVYSLALATDSSGNVIQSAQIVSVAVTAASLAGSPTPAENLAQLDALQGALKAAGFNAQLSGSGNLSVLDPPTASANSLATSYGNTIALATASTLGTDGRLALGAAGLTLTPGQILTDGTSEIGTVQSVDSAGNVTLTAAAATSIAAGDSIEVALGLAFSNVGTTLTATAASAIGSTTLALGAAGATLQPGQIVTSGGDTIGTIGSVDDNGNATLLAGSTLAVASGAALVVLPAVSATPTGAMQDAANVASIASADKTAAYETKMGVQYPGMNEALYYTRTMGSVTSIDQLMSDPTLLDVVTTSLGMSNWFGALGFDQQVSILTSKVDLKTMTTPAGIQRTSEQYLISVQGSTVPVLTGLTAMLAGQSEDDISLLSLISGTTSSEAPATKPDPVLSLFA